MSFTARYDPAEDRMRLKLQPHAGEARAYWVTRRQWLALLDLLRQARAEESGVEANLSPRREHEKAQTVADDTTAPVTLQEVRVEQGAGRTRIVLVGSDAGPGSVIGWPDAGLSRLCAQLALQAERAGWDPEPALARQAALRMARATMRRADDLTPRP